MNPRMLWLTLVLVPACAAPCTDDGLKQNCSERLDPTIVLDDTTSGESDGGGSSSGGLHHDQDFEGSSSGRFDPTVGESSGDESDAAGSSSGGVHEDDDRGGSSESSGDAEGGDDEGALPPADAWESCEVAECVGGTQCIDIADLEEYEPFCAPDCDFDEDCPVVPGGVLSWCALVPDGELDPHSCVLVCSLDDEVQGDCPGNMQCVDVPDAPTQIGVCMWA